MIKLISILNEIKVIPGIKFPRNKKWVYKFKNEESKLSIIELLKFLNFKANWWNNSDIIKQTNFIYNNDDNYIKYGEDKNVAIHYVITAYYKALNFKIEDSKIIDEIKVVNSFSPEFIDKYWDEVDKLFINNQEYDNILKKSGWYESGHDKSLDWLKSINKEARLNFYKELKKLDANNI